jgi:hypothetical protein
LSRQPGFASIAQVTPNYSEVAHVRLQGVASMRHICAIFDLPGLAIARGRWRINQLVSTLIPNLEAPAAGARKSSPRFADSIDPPWRINPDAMRQDGAEACHVTHPPPPTLSLSLFASPVYHGDRRTSERLTRLHGAAAFSSPMPRAMARRCDTGSR